MRVHLATDRLNVGDYAIVDMLYNSDVIRGAICRHSDTQLCFASNERRFDGCYSLPYTSEWANIRHAYSFGWNIHVLSCGDVSVQECISDSAFVISGIHLGSVIQRDGGGSSSPITVIDENTFICDKYSKNKLYSGIKSYHYHHGIEYNERKKKINGVKVGIELEVEFKSSTYRDKFSQSKSNWFFLERDGSLNDKGCEIISIPLNLIDAKNPKLWNPVVDALQSKAVSWDSPRCGLHVHLSKEILGKDDEEYDENLGKLLFLYHHFLNGTSFNTKIFGRASAYRAMDGKTSSAQAAIDLGKSVFKIKEIKHKIKNDLISKNKTDRYFDINVLNSNTIEFRKGRGSIKTSRIIMVIEYCEMLCKYAKSAKWDSISYENFMMFMKKNLSSKSYLYRFVDGEVCGEF